LVLLERVNEAQRYAAIELKESGLSGNKLKGKEDDEDGDVKLKKRKAHGGPGKNKNMNE